MPKMPQDWEVRQKHHDDSMTIYEKLGVMDGKSRILKFDGATFFPEMNKLGHTAAALESCECWTKRHSR